MSTTTHNIAKEIAETAEDHTVDIPVRCIENTVTVGISDATNPFEMERQMRELAEAKVPESMTYDLRDYGDALEVVVEESDDKDPVTVKIHGIDDIQAEAFVEQFGGETQETESGNPVYTLETTDDNLAEFFVTNTVGNVFLDDEIVRY